MALPPSNPYSKTTRDSFRRETQTITTDGSAPVPGSDDVNTSSTFTGSRVPNWKRKLKQHQQATSTAFGTRRKVTDTPGTSYIIGFVPGTRTTPNRWFRSQGGPHGGVVSPLAVGSVSQGTASQAAAGAFYRQARRAMTTFQGSVFAAESKDAKRMMVDRAQKILGTINPYQRRTKKMWRGKGSKRAKAKALADNYLELEFGWRPFISDIKSAHKALNEPLAQYKRVEGRGDYKHVVSKPPTSTGVIGIGKYYNDEQEFTVYSVKYYGEVRAYRGSTAGPLRDFGLHAREFAPTLLEIIPWSFALAYFTNIDDIVTSASYATADFTWIGRTTRSTRIITRSTLWDRAPAGSGNRYQSVTSIPAKSEAEATSFTREPVENVGIPSLTWHLPSLKQGLNLAALAVSNRLKLFRL